MATLSKQNTSEIPLHLFGFVQGDVTGLLLSTTSSNTVEELMEQSLRSSEIRIGHSGGYQVVHKGRILAPNLKLQDAQIRDFERIDLIRGRESNA